MNELIKITEQKDGSKAVSMKDLYNLLNVKENWTDWTKRMLGYGFEKGFDFQPISVFLAHSNGIGGTYKKDYILTLDTAKEIAMLQRSKKGREIRRYFIEIEKVAKEHLLKIPPVKIINGVRCIHYPSWLLQNGYSVTSGQVRARIKKYPEQFVKTKDGWYMSEAIGQYFLDYRNPQQRVAELPFVNPKQLELAFSV